MSGSVPKRASKTGLIQTLNRQTRLRTATRDQPFTTASIASMTWSMLWVLTAATQIRPVSRA
jgi:hypothetical protein